MERVDTYYYTHRRKKGEKKNDEGDEAATSARAMCDVRCAKFVMRNVCDAQTFDSRA